MSDTPPQYLYKYRSLSTEEQRLRVRQILLENALYFPRAEQFNDPFDCAPVPIWESTLAQTKRALMDIFQRRQPELTRGERRRKVASINKDPKHLRDVNSKVLAKLVNDVGVFSLSAKCDDILMWSHYSDSHSGICLRFATVDAPFGAAFCVRYHKNRPRVDMLRDPKEERVRKSLLTKADIWSYEEEWRIIETRGPGGPYPFAPQLLDGIIFGARISPASKDFITAAVSSRGVHTELFQADIDPELFRIVIRKT